MKPCGGRNKTKWCQCQSIGPPLWSRLKYLNNYWMDCLEILYRHSRLNPIDFGDPMTWGARHGCWLLGLLLQKESDLIPTRWTFLRPNRIFFTGQKNKKPSKQARREDCCSTGLAEHHQGIVCWCVWVVDFSLLLSARDLQLTIKRVNVMLTCPFSFSLIKVGGC